MISFDGARLLSYEHTHEFFGENLNYAVQKHLIIEGSIYSLTNQSGVRDVWSGVVGLVQSAIDYDSIIINGNNLGAGRINNISFQEGNDVRKKNYTVDLTILDSGNLFNMTGADFTGVAFMKQNIHLTESFSENFEFDLAEDGTYSYKQNVSVKYVTCDTIPDPIAAAKELASGLLFSSQPGYGFIDQSHSGFYNQPGKRIYAERYNKITNDCSFSESFSLPGSGTTYALKYTQQIQTNEDGISNVSENGHIEGLSQSDFMGAAEAGYAIQIAGAYPRAALFISAYAGGARPLNTTYTTLQKRINQFANSIDYTVSFNNDPRNQATYSWDYTQDLGRGDSCYYVVKEEGRVKGITADCTRSAQYNNALTAWTSIVRPGVTGRAQGYYNNTTHLNNPLKSTATEVRKSVHAGEIGYNYSFTDDPTYNNNQPIKRLEAQIQDDLPVPLTNKFAVANVGEIEQNLGGVKEAKRNISLRMIGKRGTLLPVYLSSGIAKLNTLIPPDISDIFVDGCTYSWSPTSNTFDLQLTWSYFTQPGGLLV